MIVESLMDYGIGVAKNYLADNVKQPRPNIVALANFKEQIFLGINLRIL